MLDTRGKFTLSIAYSPDGKYIASGAIDGIINIFEMPSGKVRIKYVRMKIEIMNK